VGAILGLASRCFGQHSKNRCIIPASGYFDLMPVLLRPQQFDGWLSGKSRREILVQW
jgi:putative SOS response-associated peptidase YedK